MDMSINYDIINIKKFNWYSTDSNRFNGDDNNGYIYGYVIWYGNQALDDALDNLEDVSWSWFKTEQERDKSFKEQE